MVSFRIVQPWRPDKARQTVIDQFSSEMVRTGAPSDAVELIVNGADGRVVTRPNAN